VGALAGWLARAMQPGAYCLAPPLLVRRCAHPHVGAEETSRARGWKVGAT